MSLAGLRASLALWRSKLAYRRRRLDVARRESTRGSGVVTAVEAKRINTWKANVAEAEQRVAMRAREIESKKRANRRAAAKAKGVGRYDGVPVALWLIPYLDWAREHGWKGRLVSGWRDPNYSRSLCLRMCGAPSCPGRCAGLSSNHVGSASPRGAVDVTDYVTFGRLMERCPLQPRIYNALGARDPVHFSATGN